ncbi:hypothetical protein D3C83_174860 [compost metagenome]
MNRKIAAGASMPPTAHSTGNSACDMFDNSPSRNSRFSSSPTSRKNIAINPSLIQCSSGLCRSRMPMRIWIGTWKNAS